MKLYLIRHGIAEDEILALRAGIQDSQRKLTPEGLEKTAKVAKAFAKRDPEIQKIFHSPYIRAKQTAEIFAENLGISKVHECPHFRPHDSVEDAKSYLLELENLSSCAFVGHQPHLGKLLSLLLCGNEDTAFHFKKAGIACVEMTVTGLCELEYFIPPKILLS